MAEPIQLLCKLETVGGGLVTLSSTDVDAHNPVLYIRREWWEKMGAPLWLDVVIAPPGISDG
jgi:hypothetical protein